jgi:hypothetical protein
MGEASRPDGACKVRDYRARITRIPLKLQVEYIRRNSDNGCAALFADIDGNHDEPLALLVCYIGSSLNHQNAHYRITSHVRHKTGAESHGRGITTRNPCTLTHSTPLS